MEPSANLQVMLLKNEHLWSHHASNVRCWDGLSGICLVQNLLAAAWSTVFEYIYVTYHKKAGAGTHRCAAMARLCCSLGCGVVVVSSLGYGQEMVRMGLPDTPSLLKHTRMKPEIEPTRKS